MGFSSIEAQHTKGLKPTIDSNPSTILYQSFPDPNSFIPLGDH